MIDTITGPYTMEVNRAQLFDHSKRMGYFAKVFGVKHHFYNDGTCHDLKWLMFVSSSTSEAKAVAAAKEHLPS